MMFQGDMALTLMFHIDSSLNKKTKLNQVFQQTIIKEKKPMWHNFKRIRFLHFEAKIYKVYTGLQK